jgi:hypothetical protein
MKKIGIITYFDSINYGAYLQCLALSIRLKKELGDVMIEVVNYSYKKIQIIYLLKTFKAIKTGGFLKMVKQWSLFIKARKELPLSASLSHLTYNKLCEKINNEYDCVIIGSDEVLNIHKDGKGWRPLPNIYWIGQDISIPSIYYAGSANRGNYEKLNIDIKKYIEQTLIKSSYIGVRDEHTLNQIYSLNVNLCPNVNCDPTFLVDFNEMFKNQQNTVKKKLKRITSKPIIAILSKNEIMASKIKERFGNRYFILSVYYPNKGTDLFMGDLSPSEWAIAFSLYAACVTELFHGTIFCLKNNLPFVSIDNNRKYGNRKSKIVDILTKAQLLENYFDLRDPAFNYEQLLDRIEQNMTTPQIQKMEKCVVSQENLFDDFLSQFQSIIQNVK